MQVRGTRPIWVHDSEIPEPIHVFNLWTLLKNDSAKCTLKSIDVCALKLFAQYSMDHDAIRPDSRHCSFTL